MHCFPSLLFHVRYYYFTISIWRCQLRNMINQMRPRHFLNQAPTISPSFGFSLLQQTCLLTSPTSLYIYFLLSYFGRCLKFNSFVSAYMLRTRSCHHIQRHPHRQKSDLWFLFLRFCLHFYPDEFRRLSRTN